LNYIRGHKGVIATSISANPISRPRVYIEL